MIAEPDVTLTDYGLAALAAGLAWAIGPGAPARSVGAWRTFFGSVAVGAAAGGTVHGFYPDPASVAGHVLWIVALLAVGATAVAAWWIAAALAPPGWARAARAAGALTGALHVVTVLAVSTDFRVAVASYVPAALFLLAVLVRAAWRGRAGAAVAALGLLILFVGSWIQWRGLGLEALRLTADAVYHVVGALALFLLFVGARRLRVSPGTPPVAAGRGR